MTLRKGLSTHCQYNIYITIQLVCTGRSHALDMSCLLRWSRGIFHVVLHLPVSDDCCTPCCLCGEEAGNERGGKQEEGWREEERRRMEEDREKEGGKGGE